jgi:hypothetical protein
MVKYLTILLLTSYSCLFGQVTTDQQVLAKTEEGKRLMDDGQYKIAYNTFKNILNSGKVLPTNLSYFFSETLYHLGQYKNSQNFIEKYLKITGKKGDYFVEATELSKLLLNKFNDIEECSFCDISGYLLITCTNCLGNKSLTESCHICSSSGINNCKKCEGEGVVIYTDLFNDNKYQTCEKCLGKGYHTCDTCQGTKSIILNCPVCLGSGLEKSENICDHKDHGIH